MRKRISLFFISTLTFLLSGVGNFLSAPPTSAISLEDFKNKEYWTTQELLMFKPIAEAERETYCADAEDNLLCRQTYYASRKSEEPIYGALEKYNGMPFLITNINPAVGTMRVIYRSISEWGDVNLPLTELVVVRFDLRYASANYVTEVRNGAPTAKTHVAYYGAADNADSPLFTAMNEEVEIPFSNPEIDENIQNKLTYVYKTGTVENRVNRYADYGNCIASGYEDGMECRLVYNTSATAYYLLYNVDDIPEEIDLPNNNDNNTVDSDQETQSQDEPTSQDAPSEAQNGEQPDEEQSNEPNEEQSAAEQPSTENDEPVESFSSIEPSAETSNEPEASIAQTETSEISKVPKIATTANTTRISPKITVTQASSVEQAVQQTLVAQTAATEETATQGIALPLGGEEITSTVSETDPDSAEFPFWTLAIIVPGLGVLIWWFLPNRD